MLVLVANYHLEIQVPKKTALNHLIAQCTHWYHLGSFKTHLEQAPQPETVV